MIQNFPVITGKWNKNLDKCKILCSTNKILFQLSVFFSDNEILFFKCSLWKQLSTEHVREAHIEVKEKVTSYFFSVGEPHSD
jgi:hypothetical protein